RIAEIPGGPDLESAIFADGIFYAAGRRGAIFTSNDGERWTARYTGTGRDLWSLAADGGVAVAVGEDGRILRSADGGATWGIEVLPSEPHVRSVVFTNAGFVASGSLGKMYLSGDGSEWEEIPGTLEFGVNSLAYDPDK